MKATKLLFLLGAFLIISTALSARAQTYDLSWFAIDGGGGTSSGGTYSLSGTIGQPDAGVLSGGNYTLTGGFWSAAIATPIIPPSPQISISVLGQDITISWPAPSTGFTLQQNTSLNPATWEPVRQTINDSGATLSITLTAPAGSTFYRLKY
ncbi:MAG: hypothetical protein ACLQVX_14500 [Limisphaerales bacterium]